MYENCTVSKRGVDRVRSGHLWIYRSDVRNTSNAASGSVVNVRDEKGRFVARALFSSSSEITLRVLTLKEEQIDQSWWLDRIRAAMVRRSDLEDKTSAYRMVYSEGDLLPSLIIDRYNDIFVLQTLSQGTELIKQELVNLLVAEFQPRAVIERNDVRVRELEGLEMIAGTLYGDPPSEILINQNGIQYYVSPLSGQKTGLFLDQRENYEAASRYSAGRVLDCFTFNGGFALHMASAAKEVIGVDVSGDAIAAAKRNSELNGFGNISFRENNVFDELREREAAGEKFDCVVLDPPAFAKNRSSVPAALRGYKEINLRALKLINPGGYLITFSCSYHISEDLLVELVAEAAGDAKRRVQLVEKRAQASDHPILLGVPETFYLKSLVLRVLD
jgi:23S rRNA (cytosine1962-C5)-methyltransferase